MVFIAIPWLVLEITGSATSTGVIVGVSYLPAIVMAPLAGILIDRWGSKQVSVLSDILSASSVVLIPLFALTVGITPALILFAALLGAVFDPAGYTARKTLIENASTSSGVRRERANSLHEAIFSFGFSIGPALAAFLIGGFGAINAFWVIALLSMMAAAAIAGVRVSPAKAEEAETPGEWWAEAIKGFTSLRADRVLLVITAFFIAVEMVYMPSEVVILPTFFEASDNPWGMGIVISAMATGGIIGSYLFDPLSRRFSLRAIMAGASVFASMALFGLAFFPPVWVMVGAGFVAGMAWGPMGPLLNTVVQTRLPSSVHGRVFGAQMALFSAGPPLGMVLAGGLVDGFGVFVVYPALVGLVLVLAIGLSGHPAMRELGRAASA
jgi:DHA3 family macrolide efflux protein-like MFS transporter